MDLTKRQKEIFDYIRKYAAKTGYPPPSARSARPSACTRPQPCTRIWRTSRRSGCCGETRASRGRSSSWWTRRSRRCAPRGSPGRRGRGGRAGARGGEHRGVPRAARRDRGRGRGLHPAGQGGLDENAGILEGDFVVVKQAENAINRRDRRRAARAGGVRQAVLPREGRIRCSPRTPPTRRSGPRTPSSSARSSGSSGASDGCGGDSPGTAPRKATPAPVAPGSGAADQARERDARRPGHGSLEAVGRVGTADCPVCGGEIAASGPCGDCGSELRCWLQEVGGAATSCRRLYPARHTVSYAVHHNVEVHKDPGEPVPLGGLALDDAFADREQEVQELKFDVLNGQDVVIFAPRRYGKSSLVWKAMQQLVADDVLVAYVNLMTTPTREKLAEKLAAAIYEHVASALDRAREAALAPFRGLRVKPRVTVDPGDGAYTFSFGVDHEYRHRRDPRAAARAAGRVAAGQDRRVALIFDEFQEIETIPRSPGADADDLRAAARGRPRLPRRRRHMMERIFSDERAVLAQREKGRSLTDRARSLPTFIAKRFEATGRPSPGGARPAPLTDRGHPMRPRSSVLPLGADPV